MEVRGTLVTNQKENYMADNTPLPQEREKPAHLREVEEDAVYITLKRFAEAAEEAKRAAEKLARENGKK